MIGEIFEISITFMGIKGPFVRIERGPVKFIGPDQVPGLGVGR
jgi:hypothetical protein